MSITGKKLLVLGAGYFQVPAIQKAQEMGHYVIALSNLPNDPGLKIADKSYPVSTLDKEAVLKLAAHEKVDGIMTIASEVAAPTVAWVAERLGLAGYSYASAATIANKLHLRQLLQREELSRLRFGDASTPELAAASMARLPRPLMLKPLFSSGSRGIKLIDGPASLEKSLQDSINQSFLFKGALLEEFAAGIPVSGELIISNGNIVASAFSQKTYNQHFVTTSQLMPLPGGRQTEVLTLAKQVIYALGLENGALDLDLVLTNDGVEIIELGSRLGGNGMAEIASLHTGLDFTKAAISIALGEKIDPVKSQNKPVAVHIIGSPKAGKLLRVKEFTEVFPSESHFLVAQSTFYAPGSPVMPLTQGNHQLGYLIVTAPTTDQLQEILQKVQARDWAEVE